MRPKLTCLLLIFFVTGCSFSVNTVKPDQIATAYKGKALPAAMNLYLDVVVNATKNRMMKATA